MGSWLLIGEIAADANSISDPLPAHIYCDISQPLPKCLKLHNEIQHLPKMFKIT